MEIVVAGFFIFCIVAMLFIVVAAEHALRNWE